MQFLSICFNVKMILIISTEYDDSTSNVVEWLIFKNKKFVRINFEDTFQSKILISREKVTINIKGENLNINLSEIKSYWYRRGNIDVKFKILKTQNHVSEIINKFNSDEVNTLKSFIHSVLSETPIRINEYNDIYLNKLNVLNQARLVGLIIPTTIITGNKNELIYFFNKHKKIITKPIYNGFNFLINEVNYYLHTLLVERKDILTYPEYFNPAKFQEYIEKAIELRIFYLHGKFFSSAIFSQNDEKTKIDFRNYNDFKPNRVVPYNLDEKIKLKVDILMKKLGLDSGSIDMIINTKGEYVFLEVNPIGQFTQVSKPCNYFLEEEIASYLQ